MVCNSRDDDGPLQILKNERDSSEQHLEDFEDQATTQITIEPLQISNAHEAQYSLADFVTLRISKRGRRFETTITIFADFEARGTVTAIFPPCRIRGSTNGTESEADFEYQKMMQSIQPAGRFWASGHGLDNVGP